MPKPWGSDVMIQSHFFGSLARFGWMSVSILGRRVSGMKKQRCSGFRRLIVATQGDGSPSIAISRAFVEVSAGTRRTIARQKDDCPLFEHPKHGSEKDLDRVEIKGLIRTLLLLLRSI